MNEEEQVGLNNSLNFAQPQNHVTGKSYHCILELHLTPVFKLSVMANETNQRSGRDYI